MRRIVHCPLCGSEQWAARQCDACHGWSDEQWALHEARELYAAEMIDIDELERRVQAALTDPPRRRHPRLLLR